MGYEYLQAIVAVGPVDLDRTLHDQAVAVLSEAYAAVQAAIAEEAADNEYPTDVVAIVEDDAHTPEEWIEQLYRLWGELQDKTVPPHAWPDAFIRELPGDPNRVIVVAGGSHYSGDGTPGLDGEGYQTFSICEALGVFEILGIR